MKYCGNYCFGFIYSNMVSVKLFYEKNILAIVLIMCQMSAKRQVETHLSSNLVYAFAYSCILHKDIKRFLKNFN